MELTPDLDFAGSMKYKNINDIHKITANHILDEYKGDKGIAVYRAVDGIHDFETGLKNKKVNTLLREHYGIGDRNNNNDFLKNITLANEDGNKGEESYHYANNKTTANKNNLHQNLDFNGLTTLESNAYVKVIYPDSNNIDTQFEHVLPTILPTINLRYIDEGETIIDNHPKGDILTDIIIDNKNLDAKDLTKLRNYLNITEGSTYSKDAANIATDKFIGLFGGNDYSFFSEILDPASEQCDMINKNTQITMVYCYLNEEPIYITLKKEAVKGKHMNSFYFQEWQFCFHKHPNTPINNFESHNFGIIKSGRSERHPAPNIETTVQYILGTIENKTLSKMASKITSAAKRVLNKGLKKVKGRDALSKEQTQNLKNNGSFDEFYKKLLDKFKKDIGDIRDIRDARDNSEISKIREIETVVLISFKTIGDQMYLYDAILLSELSKQRDEFIANPGEPFVVSGDTFLVDYITYTKSCNVLSPATMGDVRGKRKLRVYIKPIDQEKAKDALLANAARKKEKLFADINNTITDWGTYQGSIVQEKNKYDAMIKGVNNKAVQFQKISEEIIGEGRRAKYNYVFDKNDVDGFYVIETLYKILFCLPKLETMKTNIIKLQELNAKIEGIDLGGILKSIVDEPMDTDDGNEPLINNEEQVKIAIEINTYYKNILTIVDENKYLYELIINRFDTYDTDTGTETDKLVALHTLYSEMGTSKNKYKPGYHYLSTKHGQLAKMKDHLKMQLFRPDKQLFRFENRQDGGEKRKVREEEEEGVMEVYAKKNVNKKPTTPQEVEFNIKRKIMMRNYANTRKMIDIISEIMKELQINTIADLVELIVVDDKEPIVDYDIMIPDRVIAAEGVMEEDAEIVDNYKDRRDALKEEEDAEVIHPDIPLLFEISDILNSIDDYDTIERIFKDVEYGLLKVALPGAQQQQPQHPQQQLQLQQPQQPLTQGIEVGGKSKKKKTSLKKKKSRKNQTKSKKKKTKRMQIKKRKQTKKKRRN